MKGASIFSVIRIRAVNMFNNTSSRFFSRPDTHTELQKTRGTHQHVSSIR